MFLGELGVLHVLITSFTPNFTYRGVYTYWLLAAANTRLTSIHQILALLNNIQPLHITFLHHIVLARARG